MTFVFGAYVLAALVFTGLAVFVWRHPSDSGAKINMTLATSITACWALIEAASEASEPLAWVQLDFDLAARVAEGLRNVAWLLFALRLLIWITKREALIRHLALISLAAAVLAMAPVAIDIWAVVEPSAPFAPGLRTTVYFGRLGIALAGLAL